MASALIKFIVTMEKIRELRAKDFLKVITGDDIEFRIKPYAIYVKEQVVIDGIYCRCSLNFPELKFGSIIIKNSEFAGGLTFNNLQGDDFSFNGSSVGTFKILDSTIDSLEIHNNHRIEEIHLDKSSMNGLSVIGNKNFDRIHFGCENNVLKGIFIDNGSENANMAESSVYICPEQFGEMEIRDLSAAAVEIGTFGEHAVLNVNGIFTNDFKIKNCDYSKSQVTLKNIKPLHKSESHISIEDSVLDDTVMEASELNGFGNLNIENSKVGNLNNAVLELKKLQKASFWKRNISNLFFW